MMIPPSDCLDEAEIKRSLFTKWLGNQCVCLEKTGSTNQDAKRMAEEGCNHGFVIAADMQEAGRGRRGRTWESPAGENIYFTIVLRPECMPNQASMFTLVMALSVTKAIEKQTALKPGIKWPNDLVLNGKKICGILTEMTTKKDEIDYVIIGVGINVNGSEVPEELKDSATSLAIESGEKVQRAALLAAILIEFEKDAELFLKEKNLTFMQEEYHQRLLNRNREVRILDPVGDYVGVALGIDETGELLVEVIEGEEEQKVIRKVYSGEVSVRGMYGYV